jgi:hypothetical protein
VVSCRIRYMADEQVRVAAVLRGEALSPEQWAAFRGPELIAVAAFLHGRFLELALLALDDERRAATEVRASLCERIREKDHETALVAAIRSSARAVEFIPELERNRRAARAVSRELTVRAGFDAPAPLAMELARSLLPAEFVNDMLEKTLEIDQLRDYGSTGDPRDLRQDAILGAAAAYQASWDGYAPGSSTLPPFPGMPLAVAAATPRLRESRWKRAEVYGMAWEWVVSGLAPIFFDDPTTLSQAARQAYRAAWDRRDAKKRGGPGTRAAKRTATLQQRAKMETFGDQGAETAADFPASSAPDPFDRAAVRDETRYLLRHATKRWGDRGRRLLEAASAGANVEEIARQVGVSRTPRSIGLGR